MHSNYFLLFWFQAWVENPLVPVDYVNVMGVTHIEETEDFLERIGHLGTPQEMQKLTEEVRVARDGGDPGEGRLHMAIM